MFNKFKELFSGNLSSIVEPRDFVSGLRFPENINENTFTYLRESLALQNEELLAHNVGPSATHDLSDFESRYRKAYDQYPHDSWKVLNTGTSLTFRKYDGKIGLGHVHIEYIHDKNGRLIKSYDAIGEVTMHYEYDTHGFLKRASRDVRRASYGNTDKYFYTEGVLSSIESQLWSRDRDKNLPYKWGEAFTVSRD